MPTNRQFLVDHLPTGKLTPDVFRLSEGAMPTIGDGEVLVRARYISLDAANRAWMWGATYRAAVKAGEVMAGGAMGEVVESKAPGFAPGDLVWAETGWQDYAALKGQHLTKLGKAPAGQPITYLMSVYGIAGLTAYFGLLECGQPKAGETVVVSAAAGSVGTLVGQIAKIKGCRVIGIAGGAAKCEFLTRELGFDAAVDYKAPEFSKAMRAAVPKGIDVYFDNVGGDTLVAVIRNLAQGARIVLCGMIEAYSMDKPPPGPWLGPVVGARAIMKGLVVYDHVNRMPEMTKVIGGWIRDGSFRYREDITEGLAGAPEAFCRLMRGENFGKSLVRIGKA